MPHQSYNPDHPSTLPQPDLNPLLNPVLAKNIGRWAEVYFTNPPEKREQAVQELIRELEREGPVPEGSVASQSTLRRHELERENATVFSSADVPTQGRTCHSCGYENRPKHKFCGRCGVRIAPAAFEAREEQEPRGDLPESSPSPEYHESPIFGFESTPRWQSYRLYAGVVLALVVLILGYMAWRSTQTTSGASHVAPQAPPVEANPVASTPQPPSPKVDAPKADTSSQIRSAGDKPEGSPSETAATRPTAPVAQSPAAAHSPVPVSTSPENGPGTPALTGGGSEELAVARNLLNGTNGKDQAVPWLWKAVAKQNVEATVLLSNLYLRGDGVPKNCEQARLLLDAAALKGRKDAAVQLRNLQAFGCE